VGRTREKEREGRGRRREKDEREKGEREVREKDWRDQDKNEKESENIKWYIFQQFPQVVNSTPYSLGVELADGQMAVLIHKNSIVPIRKTLEFSTAEDNQTAVFLQVYEGEDPVAKNNNLLGR
jgi:molecular chaperone DnaK (HSP70)